MAVDENEPLRADDNEPERLKFDGAAIACRDENDEPGVADRPDEIEPALGTLRFKPDMPWLKLDVPRFRLGEVMLDELRFGELQLGVLMLGVVRLKLGELREKLELGVLRLKLGELKLGELWLNDGAERDPLKPEPPLNECPPENE